MAESKLFLKGSVSRDLCLKFEERDFSTHIDMEIISYKEVISDDSQFLIDLAKETVTCGGKRIVI